MDKTTKIGYIISLSLFTIGMVMSWTGFEIDGTPSPYDNVTTREPRALDESDEFQAYMDRYSLEQRLSEIEWEYAKALGDTRTGDIEKQERVFDIVKTKEPPENSIGYDYEKKGWRVPIIESRKGKPLSEAEVEEIRRNLPDDKYLYTPGNPRKYRSTDEKIEEYIEDNIDEIMEDYEYNH